MRLGNQFQLVRAFYMPGQIERLLQEPGITVRSRHPASHSPIALLIRYFDVKTWPVISSIISNEFALDGEQQLPVMPISGCRQLYSHSYPVIQRHLGI